VKKWTKRLLWLVLGGWALLVIGVGLSSLNNLTLPTHSQLVDSLSFLEKARLQEAFHLRETIGDQVWPGWAEQKIPIIVYNEKNAFLVGYQNPPPGWLKVPQRLKQGGQWIPVPDDTFFGETYYYQPLQPGHTPQSFTVLVGDRWVATMPTREYMEIYLYSDLHHSLPPVIRTIVPYKLIWRTLLGETDTYIAGLEHESFHAFQGMTAPSRLDEAENAVRLESKYPWNDPVFNASWQVESALLVKAIRARSDAEAKVLGMQFLEKRDVRRRAASLSGDLIDYERQREWLEGLAKYSEVSIGRSAAAARGYQPCDALKSDADFKNYSTRSLYWSRQLDEVPHLMGHSDEKRFYYSGMAQAILLDRLSPGWKQQILSPGVFQEELLLRAVTN